MKFSCSCLAQPVPPNSTGQSAASHPDLVRFLNHCVSPEGQCLVTNSRKMSVVSIFLTVLFCGQWPWLSLDDYGASQLVMPALFAFIESDPYKAQPQWKQTDEISEVSDDVLDGGGRAKRLCIDDD